MTDRFAIELDPAGELLARLDLAIARMGEPGELLDSIGAVMESNIQARFDAKVAPDGTAWSPIKDSTRKRYEKQYNGAVPGSLLERTRHMRDSLAFNVGTGYVEVGFSDPKAAYHEYGTRRMEARRLLMANPDTGRLGAADEADLLTEVERYLQGLLG